jgi:hypothetical protein
MWSRQDVEEEATAMALTMPSFSMFNELCSELDESADLCALNQ